MSDPDFVTVLADEYRKMQDDLRFLEALRAAGVDNWDGYDFVLEFYHGEIE